VVVVTWNAADLVERCLASVQGRDVVVVDNGSTDGTVALVRERYPDVRVVEQENKGMGGGNNAGMRVAGGRYYFLLNSDAWVMGDGLDRLVEFADEHPGAAVVGPRLLNLDGTLQRSVRGEPTLWRLATEYLFIRKLAPRSHLLNAFYAGGFEHDRVYEADWLFGPALLVRRDAVDAVGLFDEDFFMFSEETDWLTRFRRAGWKVLFFPGAEVTHVGGASHGGRMYVENLRGHLRWFAKHRGARQAERARRLMLMSLRLRALIWRSGLRGEQTREGIRFLSSGPARKLLEQ
jgi:GT2 family glycosyltransferase